MALVDRAVNAVYALGTTLGHPFQWDGSFVSRNANTPNIFSGTGVPAAPAVTRGRVGDLYFRCPDGGGPGATHIYYCTVAGAPGTWIGIA